ncbi:MAG: rhodanese-like domain-containing protein [Candidatus Moraniibacteriota bacterium]
MNPKQKNENKVILIGMGLIFLISSFYIIQGLSSGVKDEQTERKSEELFSDYTYITASELEKKIINQEKISLLDVRDSVNFEKNHIEGSLNVSSQNLNETLQKISKEEFVAIIGYNYERKKEEASVAQILSESGFKNFKVLTGGIVGWAEEGNRLISSGDKESALDWSKVDQIIPEQLKFALENNYPVFIVDVRKSFLYTNGHIPKAVNIPLEELEKRKSDIPFSKEILVYGADADEDFSAAVKLHDLGFLATYTLQGGFAAWQEKRFEIEK